MCGQISSRMAEWFVTIRRPNYVGYPSHRLKLVRALEHLGELHSSVQAFGESSPYTITLDDDLDTGEKVAKIKLPVQPPVGISVLAADAIHNLRQALDHLAYQVAILVSGSDPPPNEETAAWPIHNTEKAFRDQLGRKIGTPTKIPKTLLTILESLQPYQGGDGDMLRILRDMDDGAKHRYYPAVAGIVRTASRIEAGSVAPLVQLEPLEVGETEVARFKPVGTQVKMEGTFEVNVIFGPGSPAAGLMVTQYIQATREMLTKRLVEPSEAILYPSASAP